MSGRRPPSFANESDMFRRLIAILFLFLLLNAAFIAAFPSATLFYVGNVLLHLIVGFALTVVLVRLLVRSEELRREIGLPAGLLIASAVLAAYLTAFGATRDHNWALRLHIITAVAGVIL